MAEKLSDFTKLKYTIYKKGVSLRKLPNCGAPTCTGGSVRHSFGSFLSETPFLNNVYFSHSKNQLTLFENYSKCRT